jgi:hypothetical protein
VAQRVAVEIARADHVEAGGLQRFAGSSPRHSQSSAERLADKRRCRSPMQCAVRSGQRSERAQPK